MRCHVACGWMNGLDMVGGRVVRLRVDLLVPIIAAVGGRGGWLRVEIERVIEDAVELVVIGLWAIQLAALRSTFRYPSQSKSVINKILSSYLSRTIRDAEGAAACFNVPSYAEKCVERCIL